MGVWGYFQPPLEPTRDYGYAWEDMAEQESLDEFIEQEMSYADWVEHQEHTHVSFEEIGSDEGGWARGWEGNYNGA